MSDQGGDESQKHGGFAKKSPKSGTGCCIASWSRENLYKIKSEKKRWRVLT